MKKMLVAAILSFGAIVMATAACGGTTCDAAADIDMNCAGRDAEAGEVGGSATCVHDALCLAECIVNNEAGYCEMYADEPSAETMQGYNDCVTACAETEEG